MNIKHNNRLTYIFLSFIMFYIILIFNLYIIQINNSSFFQNLGRQQYQTILNIQPLRAEILDRNNNPLAINKDSIAAFIIPSEIKNLDSLKNFLEKEFKQAYFRLENNKNSNFMYIKRKLTEDEIKKILESEQHDIKLLKEPNRYYPNPTTATVIGITNIDNQGISGLEYFYNEQLSGKSSKHLLCKDAHSGYFYFENQTKIDSPNNSLTTTLDSTLQFLAYEELKDAVQNLGAKLGSVLILNPTNGDILAMVNYPDFNPNNTENLDIENTKNYISNDAYELGSVIKIFLAMAAFDEEVVTNDELINCENKKTITLNGITFSTTKAHDILPFSDVVVNSNNIGVAKVALRLGNKIYSHYKKMGFGTKIGIFPGENPGIINPPKKWSAASPISLSFGYEISSTLLQLAQAMMLVINNGYLIKPRLILTDDIPEKIGPLYKTKTINSIRDLLLKTANKVMINKNNLLKDFTIIGKTGTARLLTNGLYDPNKNIFTFIGIIEKGEYKRVVVTFIKETTKKNVLASAIAVPLFEKIVEKLIIHDKVL